MAIWIITPRRMFRQNDINQNVSDREQVRVAEHKMIDATYKTYKFCLHGVSSFVLQKWQSIVLFVNNLYTLSCHLFRDSCFNN